MLAVKHFVSGTTRQALVFLDNEVREWLQENKITEVKFIRETFGQAPTGMSGTAENSLFVSIWYEKPE
ncbi:MAG TPA: hypothetical protein PKN80_01490 [bacterium]|uniref:Uncharacterized protein n=1 Tax=candidate division TA06 bacterium ADurb.Bin417 TaxID=1852828 RepID=A0A1V5MK50_UNCT6|nr:MAG: hypothetical protein BWY73_00235 [candidate division TA06 bacterium ADurb.Bin417]HNQ34722.1 hypothetical protein [bacterium]HNS48656.1 hypothetical protein [bacterium]